MSKPENQFDEIRELIRTSRMDEAQNRTVRLLNDLDTQELKRLSSTIQDVIALFFPKRRKMLFLAFETRLANGPTDGGVATSPSRSATQPVVMDRESGRGHSQLSMEGVGRSLTSNNAKHPRRIEHDDRPSFSQLMPLVDSTVNQNRSIHRSANVEQETESGAGHTPAETRGARPSQVKRASHAVDIGSELRIRFVELSRNHMFEWRTFYREAVTQMFDRIEGAFRDTTNPSDICYVVTTQFSQHANEIFGKGYTHLTQNRFISHVDSLGKALGGLQKFLELPLEFYSSRATNAASWAEVQAIRATCSAMLSGILEGFGQTQFGDVKGWKTLPQHARHWAHYLGFLMATDIDRIESEIAASPLRDGIRDSVTPVIRALDQVIAECHHDVGYLPGLGQFNSNSWRFELSLLLPPSVESKRYLEVHCYLKQSHVSQAQLLESANRGASLIAAPMRRDLQDWVDAHELLRTLVINTAPGLNNQIEQSTQRAAEILRFEVARYSRSDDVHAPLKYNFARDFPLHNPALKSYFHVHRVSVRNLLRTFDSRNGIRLWCSVRRSGKTTASSDLGDTTGSSSVITQTCDNTEQYADSGRFYDTFVDALETGRQISTSFFTDVVARCLKEGESLDTKIVFVLDEYETLFGRMGAAVKRDRELRYTVVQPLLNQMVAFSRQNLLIFIGQRPDAHFIIMDQNQLSPYVEQDSFPLFEHTPGATSSEFRNFLNKVLTNRTTFDDSFVNAIYLETGGHPWLTVNILVDFFDWLIQENRSVKRLHFSENDLAQFAVDRLTSSWISICDEYGLFRKVISEALSDYGQDWDPWLHAVYATMRRIVEENPQSMTCSRSRFAEIVHELKLPQEFGYKPDDLLNTAVPSNFLAFDGLNVGPRIPLMARISLVAHPKVRW